MKAVSLFAGIGGFDLALERAGVDVIASVEIDKHARKVLAKRFPKTHLLEDVQEVTGEHLFKLGFDSNGVIVGGFPCQDLSHAGKRAGLAGARSGLFWEICRLLDETKAKYFILENVPGLLSSNGGADMEAVIGALVERGYGVAYRVLDAQYFGVPQRRRRVFIVGSLGDSGREPAEILDLFESGAGYLTEGGTPGKSSSSAFVERSKRSDSTRSDIVGVVSEGSFGGFVENDVTTTLRASSGTNGGGSEALVIFKPHQEDGARVQGDVVNTLTSYMGTGGNNVPMVAAYSIREDAKANSFSATPTDTALALNALQPSTQSHHAQLFIAQEVPTQSFSNQTVRRLTPTECERLQGFPDGWTEGQADSHRYKQLGNAVAVPCVQWMIDRLVAIA
jgi:DNA (cytosine-5)-methyltransferase 1